MKPVEAAHRWALVWQSAWEALDVESIVALYAEDAVLSTEPFREAYRGQDGVRSYVSRVFGEEEAPTVSMGKPIVSGDSAAIPWWANLREEGIDVTLAGTSLLRFDVSGLVAEQWDTWNLTQGHHDPPGEWGPFA